MSAAETYVPESPPTRDELDAALVRRYQAGDPDALDALLCAHAARLLAVWRRYRVLAQDHGDLRQELALRAVTRLLSWELEGPGTVGRWLERTAEHVASEHQRTERLRGAVVERLRLVPGPTPTPAPSGLSQRLRAAAGTLTPAAQEILALYLAGVSVREIAEETGTPRSTVHADLGRSVGVLRATLGERLFTKREK